METIRLKTIDGQTVQVVNSTQTQEVPFGAEEIKRQISQHAEVINNLQKQLEAVQGFESSGAAQQTVTLAESIKPLIDMVELEKVVKAEVIEVIEEIQ